VEGTYPLTKKRFDPPMRKANREIEPTTDQPEHRRSGR
jgi:hypothetical protein